MVNSQRDFNKKWQGSSLPLCKKKPNGEHLESRKGRDTTTNSQDFVAKQVTVCTNLSQVSWGADEVILAASWGNCKKGGQGLS